MHDAESPCDQKSRHRFTSPVMRHPECMEDCQTDYGLIASFYNFTCLDACQVHIAGIESAEIACHCVFRGNLGQHSNESAKEFASACYRVVKAFQSTIFGIVADCPCDAPSRKSMR